MSTWKSKWALGLILAVLAVSLALGAAVWHFASNYEKTASVYVKSLDWILPLSTDYQYISIDESSDGLYLCRKKDQIDYRDPAGKLVQNVSLTEYEANSVPYVETRDQLDWKTYKGRKIHAIWSVDEDTYAVSFKGKKPEDGVSGYMLFDRNMKPVLEDRMFEVILEESDDMRYFISSETDFDGRPAKKECGFLDAAGDVAFIFDHIPRCVNSFSEGLALVYDDKLYGYDKDGKIVFALDYTGNGIAANQRQNYEEDTTYSPYYTRFSDGLAPVTLDGVKMGYIDTEGKMAVEPLFKEAGLMLNGTAAVCLIQSDSPSTLVKSRWGILNLKGVQ